MRMLTSEQVEDVRLAVYGALSEQGQAPRTEDLESALGLTAAEVCQALRSLADHRDVVLDDDGRILMAHPFATIPLGFSVMGVRTLWWGGCAWDSFAVPHLVPGEPEVLVATTCPGCGRPHALVVSRDQPPSGAQVAHFLTPTSRIWVDVVRSCGNQRIFCGRDCVDRWLAQESQEIGYVMDLATLWRLARGWYQGRLDRGYQRREPAEAAAYFREVGLEGPFWGLD